MSDKAAPLPASSLAVLNGMLERFCPAEGPGFLRCGRARGHDGPHYDIVRQLDWSAPVNESEGPR